MQNYLCGKQYEQKMYKNEFHVVKKVNLIFYEKNAYDTMSA